MTHERHRDHQREDRHRDRHRDRQRPFAASAPSSRADLARPIAVGLLMATAFVTIFLSALHDPEPHDLPVAVVGTADQSAATAQALESASPDSFEVRPYDTAGEAEDALRARDVYGVMDLTGARTVRISYAGANGSGVTAAVEEALSAAADGMGRPSATADAVPLHHGDSRGLSVFYFVFGLALSAFLFAMTFHQVAAGASLGVRVGVPMVFAAVTGVGLSAIAGPGFEALTGHFWAVAVIAAMISLAVSTSTAALTRLFGGPGIGLAGLLAIVIGNATSGGALNWHFLPDGWRAVSQHLPTGAGVTALLDVQYFDAADPVRVILTLAAWIATSLLILIALPLLGLDAVHRAHRIQHGRHERAIATASAE